MSRLAAVPAMTPPPPESSVVASTVNPADGGTFDAMLAHSTAPASSKTPQSGGNTNEPVATPSFSETAPSEPASIGDTAAPAHRGEPAKTQLDARVPPISARLSGAAPEKNNAMSDVHMGASRALSAAKASSAAGLDRSSFSVSSIKPTSPIGTEPAASPHAQHPIQLPPDVAAPNASTDIATGRAATTTPAIISAVASAPTMTWPPVDPLTAKLNASHFAKPAPSDRIHNGQKANVPALSADVAAFAPDHAPATTRVSGNSAGNTPEPALKRVSRTPAISNDSAPTTPPNPAPTAIPASLLASGVTGHSSAPVTVTADRHVAVATARTKIGAPPAAIGAHAATREIASTAPFRAASHQYTEALDTSPSSMATFAATGDLANLDIRATSTPITGHVILPGVASQLLDVIAPFRQAPNGMQSVTISLHPVELGEVHVAVTLVDGQTTVRLAAATPEGASAIRAALPNLESQLANSGQHAHVVFDNSAFTGSQSHSNSHAWTGSQPHQQPSRGQVAQRLSTAEVVASPPATSAPIASDHAIDVRI